MEQLLAVRYTHSGYRRVPKLTVTRLREHGGDKLLAEYLSLWSKARPRKKPGFRLDYVRVNPEVVTLYECMMLDRPDDNCNHWVIYKTVPTADLPLRKMRSWDTWECPAVKVFSMGSRVLESVSNLRSIGQAYS